MLLGDLTPGDRQKIMTVCTIDVHARDVVASLISQKVSMAHIYLVRETCLLVFTCVSFR